MHKHDKCVCFPWNAQGSTEAERRNLNVVHIAPTMSRTPLESRFGHDPAIRFSISPMWTALRMGAVAACRDDNAKAGGLT